MSDSKLDRSHKLIKEYPFITDMVWMLMGAALIIGDIFNMVWVIGAFCILLGVYDFYMNSLKKKGDA